MMNSLYFKLGALAAAFAVGFWLNGTLWESKWSERDMVDALSVVAAQEAERTKERQWQADIQRVHDDAKKRQETIAADAAVLAGAKAYAENNEKPDDHPKADARAKEYIVGQYHNLAADEDIKTLKYKAQNFQEKTYYHVELSKDEPLYFLSFTLQSHY